MWNLDLRGKKDMQIEKKLGTKKYMEKKSRNRQEFYAFETLCIMWNNGQSK
jgi:hypothetical protein